MKAMPMKTKSLMFILTCMGVSMVGHSMSCEDWESKLQTDIRKANQCETKHQACLAKEFGNPMRELDYCKKYLKTANPWMQGQRKAPYPRM
jgi:hypothetical protein